ncbi:5'-3' exonuclease [Ruficoccus amylovorans]|uniref:5'-3' exonuclease n=1 Tax=Ruficoccus amylovorans TaxID=1804625 RepID=A0A842HDR0_9BACT|nr:5'-3' exonuclease H3TH domain-containing protein [Ruficoccus amylovorans]MBC2594685.1 5'-3' exonuclease [Ruficoccus amylovorans]
MAKVLLLDGFNLAFRSYYALPELTRSDGVPTGALHGWVKTLWKLEDMERPDRLAVFFDEGGSDRHLELLPEYKANRDEMPEALRAQMASIREITRLMGYPVISRCGVEADDLIASAARKWASPQERVVVVSADKDLAQLVNGEIHQLLPAPTANPRLGWRRLDGDGVVKKFGVTAAQIPDYLALVGDAADNIAGIAGVGPKTAANWIGAYGDIAGVLAAATEIKPPRFREILPASAELLRRNLELVRLCDDFEIPEVQIEAPHTAELSDFLASMEMKTAAMQAHERYGLGLR